MMEKTEHIASQEDTIKLLNIALKHEWAVNLESSIHTYSMPKGKFFYEDLLTKRKTDIRAQTIQIGSREMDHALQLGIVITQMRRFPSFKTDEVMPYPKILDNLKR